LNRYKRTFTIFFAAVLVALLPRLLLLPAATRMGLGLDETQSAIYSYLPIDQMLKSLELYDPHPPLYYLQLHVWEKAGTGDVWLRLNSVLWSVLAVAALSLAGKKVYNLRVGTAAALMLGLSPLAVGFSMELRMYSLLLLAAVGVWYFTHQFAVINTSRSAGAGLLLSTLVCLYSHGAAFLILPCGVTYFSILFGRNWRRLGAYLLLQGAVLILYAPWLLHAWSVNPRHGISPGFSELAYTFTQFLFGNFAVLSSYQAGLFWLSAVLFTGLVAVLAAHPHSRTITLSFILVPLLSSFLVSILVVPVWLTRTMLFILPFMCLGTALVLVDLIDTPRRGGVPLLQAVVLEAVCLAALVGLVYQQQVYAPWTPVKESAALIRSQAQGEELVYIPHYKMYWGWGWYYFGPGIVHPLWTNYREVDEGITVVGRPAAQSLDGNWNTLWVVRRQFDDLGTLGDMLELSALERVGEFRNVFVDKTKPGDRVFSQEEAGR
jgi:mannosyltransferase